MLKRIGTKPTVCTSWDTAKTTDFVVVFACWQNSMQIFAFESNLEAIKIFVSHHFIQTGNYKIP